MRAVRVEVIVDAWRDFTFVTKLIRNFKSLYGLRGRCLKIRHVCMDFDPCSKVHNLVYVHPKSTILGQMTNLNMTFHVVVSLSIGSNLKLAPVPCWISERHWIVTCQVFDGCDTFFGSFISTFCWLFSMNCNWKNEKLSSVFRWIFVVETFMKLFRARRRLILYNRVLFMFRQNFQNFQQ